MVKEIVIYIEGGGNTNETQSKLRKSFRIFFRELDEIAKRKKIKLRPIACGSREDAFRDFCRAVKSNCQAFNALLVDSEGPVSNSSAIWSHLKQQDSWDCPTEANDDNCFFMAESMETWLIADQGALKTFYGPQLNVNKLPTTSDLETVDKRDVLSKLEAATKNCRGKGTYHKTRHAFDILAIADPIIVRKSANHCKRLFTILSGILDDTIDDD